MYQKDWSKLGPVIECFERDADSEREMLESLDPGIRRIVQILRENGVRTFESCQSGAGHIFPQPTVRFEGEKEEGYRAFRVAAKNRLPVCELRRTWDVTLYELIGPVWEMTFILAGAARPAWAPHGTHPRS